MQDVDEIQMLGQDTFRLDTGSPHIVKFVSGIQDLDVVNAGREIRNSPTFVKAGINVNFVEKTQQGTIRIRTYERGVENETLACGTGVVASAIVSAFTTEPNISTWTIHASGGILRVDFSREASQVFRNVTLSGPAVNSFNGEFHIPD
jgi:diaminopimelate epimerase